MYKLINFSVDPWDLDKFDNNSSNITAFLKKHQIDGFEMFQYANWNDTIFPNALTIGVHMGFWPMWLEFWKNDQQVLLRQFGDEKTCQEYYRCATRDEFIHRYREELRKANEIGVRYVLFHVCHVEPEQCLSYEFNYSDEEVIEAFLEMINQVFEGLKVDFDVYFENNWWPGLTLVDQKIAQHLLDGFNYPNKGFVLDLGHLMNTNMDLKTEEEATDYILETIESLGEVSRYIKGLHINSTLSGEYVKKMIKNKIRVSPDKSFMDKYSEVYEHIANIDRHLPFKDSSIQKIINRVKPQYIVYEFLAQSIEELDQYIQVQDIALESCINN